MKKGISILLIGMMLLALAGCGGGTSAQPAQSSSSAQSETSAEAEVSDAAASSVTETQAEAASTVEAESAEPEVQSAVESAQDEKEENEEELTGASPFVGNWLYYSQKGINGGQTVTHDEVEQYREQGYSDMVDMILSIYEDETCKLLWIGEVSEGSWTDNGDGTGSLQVEGKTMSLSIQDGMLQAKGEDNISSFEKTDRSAE